MCVRIRVWDNIIGEDCEWVVKNMGMSWLREGWFERRVC